jgi:two-component system LytT family response regulator
MRDGRDLQVVIAAGDQAIRSQIRKYAEAPPGVHVAAECATAEETGRFLAGTPTDLLILDTALPESGGFSFLRSLPPDRRPAVVFTANSEDQAVAAFQFHPIDYLMFPLDGDRLISALQRVRLQSWSDTVTAPDIGLPVAKAAPHAQPKRLMVKTAGRICFLKADEIDWIEADRDYVRLYNGQRKHLLRSTISGMERQLQGERFIRIHRSTIVNVDRIREMQPLSYGEYAVILYDGTRLTLSRSFRERVFEHMMTAA